MSYFDEVYNGLHPVGCPCFDCLMQTEKQQLQNYADSFLEAGLPDALGHIGQKYSSAQTNFYLPLATALEPEFSDDPEEQSMLKDKSTIKPILIGPVGSMDPAIWGGKAASLGRLKAFARVPTAWALPCKHTFTRERIAFPLDMWPSRHGPELFSVRSGAPVSMPGMMDTKLDVPFKDLRKAAQEVWDSWDSERAKEYRAAKGISDSLGTAVIFQAMVPAQKLAGTAFSVSPDAPPESQGTYNPVIEIVEGTGEKLVSGAASGKRVRNRKEAGIGDFHRNWFAELDGWLKHLHRNYGPSDIEFAVDEYNIVWMLQHRNMKFAAQASTLDLQGREVLVRGKSIGAKRAVVARLEHAANLGAKWTPKEPTAVFLDSFNPAYYPLMMKAEAIITQEGGETCHAAIVAREFDRPAISDIYWGRLASHAGQRILINPTDASISLAKVDDTASVAPKVRAIRTPLRPNLSIRQVKWDACELLARTYYVLTEKREGRMAADVADAAMEEIAQVISSYHYIIVAGEARHFRMTKQNEADPSLIEKLGTSLRTRGCMLPRGGDKKPSREDFAIHYLYQPRSLARALEVVDLLQKVHGSLQWGGGYGGPKWANINTHLGRYLRGEINATMYVDGCWNLQHNGGRAFNKFDWFAAEDCRLGALLNYKAESFEKFWASILSREKKFAMKDTIIDKLVPLGPDKDQKLLPEDFVPQAPPPKPTTTAKKEAPICADCKASADACACPGKLKGIEGPPEFYAALAKQRAFHEANHTVLSCSCKGVCKEVSHCNCLCCDCCWECVNWSYIEWKKVPAQKALVVCADCGWNFETGASAQKHFKDCKSGQHELLAPIAATVPEPEKKLDWEPAFGAASPLECAECEWDLAKGPFDQKHYKHCSQYVHAPAGVDNKCPSCESNWEHTGTCKYRKAAKAAKGGN